MGINAWRTGVAEEIFDRYRALGGMSFDTARMYYGGECDRMLGEYINSRGIRHETTVCMKGCYPLEQAKMHEARLAPEDIVGDLEKSLRAFGTDYADMYLLHRDDPARSVEEIVPVLDRLVREGKTGGRTEAKGAVDSHVMCFAAELSRQQQGKEIVLEDYKNSLR